MKKTKLLALLLIAVIALPSCGAKTNRHDWAVIDVGGEYAVIYDGKPLDCRIEYEKDESGLLGTIRTPIICPNEERACFNFYRNSALCTPDGVQVFDGRIVAYSNDGKNFLLNRMTTEPREGELLIDYRDIHTLCLDGKEYDFGDKELNCFSPGGNLIAYTETVENSQKLYINWIVNGEMKPFVEKNDFDGSVVALPDSGKYAFVVDSDRMLSKLDLETLEITEYRRASRWITKNADCTELLFESDGRLCLIKDCELHELDRNYSQYSVVGYGRANQYDRPETFVGSIVLTRDNDSGLIDVCLLGSDNLQKLAGNYDQFMYTELHDGCVYYIAGESNDLYRIRIPDGTPEKLAENVSKFFLAGSGVYCVGNDSDPTLWWTDGKSSRVISESPVVPYGVFNDIFFFCMVSVEPDGVVWSSKNGGEKTVAYSGIDYVRVYKTFVMLIKGRTGQTGQTEYFLSTDGKHFNQFFY